MKNQDPLDNYIPEFDYEIHLCADNLKDVENADVYCLIIGNKKRVLDVSDMTDAEFEQLLVMHNIFTESLEMEYNRRQHEQSKKELPFVKPFDFNKKNNLLN